MGVKVSVICPAWNRHQLMQRCVRSVLGQSFREFEFVVVDDGSTPEVQVPGHSGGIDIRVVRHNTNHGPAMARNTGAAMAEGEWLAFIDSDDEWATEKLERQVAFAERHPRTKTLQAFVTGFEIMGRSRTQGLPRYPRPARSIEEFAAGCWYCPGSTLLIRRDVFSTLNGFDDKLPRLEDYEFFLRFGLAGGELFVLPEVLSRIYVDVAPSAYRVGYATECILEQYENAPGITPAIFSHIAAFCRLVKAENYYKHGNVPLMLWNLAVSFALLPRWHMHLIRRFDPPLSAYSSAA